MGRHGRSICAASLAVALAAVGAAAAQTTTVPQKLVGCWHRNVTDADFTKAGTGGFPTGVWSFSIKKGGALAVFTPGTGCNGASDFTSSVSATATRMTFHAVPVCTSNGVYSWKVSGKRLTLRHIADNDCEPRVGLFDGVWKRT